MKNFIWRKQENFSIWHKGDTFPEGTVPQKLEKKTNFWGRHQFWEGVFIFAK